ncbi:hypothetical protein [Roseibium sediminicola]|uniref:Uncharacterized protein n=1 Tax=Roseibium sediminicola TaxID=2933272 RepID=A0ABT0H1Q4_9HYPH|nr:hypothetical protein [Roseibium sp. CAU 1639]MCK7615623.1 hypothetical protein [Roseibium sp. CAU 1639]
MGVVRDKDRANREKIEENMLKKSALCFPKTSNAATAVSGVSVAAWQAKARNTAARLANRSQNIEFKDIFGMAGRLS